MELVPNIAFGDLGQSSLAEVVAAGFRAFATGTISVEQGKGESRLFMRYGIPCGTQLFIGFKPFGYYLHERGVLETVDLDRFLQQAADSRRKLGEILVEAGVVTRERMLDLVTGHHLEALNDLCVLREGKYELRGWERPPPWTEQVALDPLNAVARALAADELFDRRAAILDQIGSRKLRLSDDFDDQAGRLALTAAEHDILARLHLPRTARDLAESLARNDADAFVAALALLGLIDADEPARVPVAPAAEEPPPDEYGDASLLLRPLEATQPPVLAPDVGFGDAMLPVAAEPMVGEADTGLVSPGAYGASTRAGGLRTVVTGDEIEFESEAEDAPLELDLQRAPKEMRAHLEAAHREAPRPKLRAVTPVGRTPVETLPGRPAASVPRATPVRPISSIGHKAVSRNPEYNPFAVHFRHAAAAAADLESRLDSALRAHGPAAAPEPAPVRRAARATIPERAPRPPPAPVEPVGPKGVTDEVLPERTPRPPPAAPSQILADIADLVGDLQEAPQPITLTETPKVPVQDDDLAILAAQEVAAEERTGGQVIDASGDPETPGLDDGVPINATEMPAQENAKPEEEAERSEGEAPAESTPPSRDELRRRMKLRSFRNVPGGLMSLQASEHAGVRRPDAPAARPDIADAELERDITGRMTRLVGQDHFARLGLERTVGTDEVKEAFLSLAKRYHPDRITALGQNHLLPQVRELFARIKESYDVLVDPASRARYIAELGEKEGSRNKLTPEEARTAYQRGLIFLRKKDFTNAEAELIRATGSDPMGEYLAELAWTLFQNPARREDARSEIRDLIARAMKSGTDGDRTYVVAAYIARADGDPEKAERHFRKALEKNPKNIEAAQEVRLIDRRRSAEKKSSGIFERLRPKPPANKS